MESDDFDSLQDYYVAKIDKHRRMQHFFKVIPMPKYPTLFKILVMLLFVRLELAANTYSIHTFFIPSVACIIFLWYYQMAVNAAYLIADNCIVEEIIFQDGLKNNPEGLLANFPYDPLYVTEEDRQSFIDEAIMDYKNHCTSLR